MTLLADIRLQVLIPGMPSDIVPTVERLLPLPQVYVPRGRGTLMAYRAPRYPDVHFVWICQRYIHDVLTIDRFRPAAQGGLYGWDNVGVLCAHCNRFKGQHWPWVDYRPSDYKRKIERYLQDRYGRQLWLPALEKFD